MPPPPTFQFHVQFKVIGTPVRRSDTLKLRQSSEAVVVLRENLMFTQRTRAKPLTAASVTFHSKRESPFMVGKYKVAIYFRSKDG